MLFHDTSLFAFDTTSPQVFNSSLVPSIESLAKRRQQVFLFTCPNGDSASCVREWHFTTCRSTPRRWEFRFTSPRLLARETSRKMLARAVGLMLREACSAGLPEQWGWGWRESLQYMSTRRWSEGLRNFISDHHLETLALVEKVHMLTVQHWGCTTQVTCNYLEITKLKKNSHLSFQTSGFIKAISCSRSERNGEIHFLKTSLTENLELQMYCCSTTESCLLSQRMFLILYHSEQMMEKKNRSEVGTDSLN